MSESATTAPRKYIVRRGNILAPRDIMTEIEDKMPRAVLISSFDNTTCVKTQARLRDLATRLDWHTESVFDAAHGRRYMCFVYRSREERAEIWEFLVSPEKKEV